MRVLGFVGFIYVLEHVNEPNKPQGGRCVHTASFGSLHRVLEVFGSSGDVSSLWSSSGVVEFNRVRSGGRWVHQGSLGSLVCAMVVIGFMRDRWVRSRAPRGRWIHAGSLGSLWRSLV